MLVLKKNKTIMSFNNIKMMSLFLLLSFIGNQSFANTVNIKSTHAYKEESTYYLDTLFDFKLTDEADKALRHGVPLEIHTHFQLRLKRKWLWNKTISEKKIVYKLEHKPLTNNFLTINMDTGLRNSYDSLDAALNHINVISKLKLFDQALLQKDKNYIARIKSYLDTKSLPPPLRPQAYFSSEWDMSSDWFEWEVIQ